MNSDRVTVSHTINSFGRGGSSPNASSFFSRALIISRSSKDSSRFATIQAHASAAEVQTELFEAVDKDHIRERSMPTAARFIRAGIMTNHTVKRPGTLACALSHLEVWRALAASGSRSPWLVFEDDSLIPANFASVLARVLPSLPHGWQFAFLNHNKLHGLAISRQWFRPSTGYRFGTNGLTNAYLVTPAGARAALKLMLPFNAVPDQSVDNVLKNLWSKELAGYFLRCCLVPQAVGPSVRGTERRLAASSWPDATHAVPGSSHRAVKMSGERDYAEGPCQGAKPGAGCSTL